MKEKEKFEGRGDIAQQDQYEYVRTNAFGKFIVYLSFLLIIPAIVFLVTRNKFVRMRTKIEEASSSIDIQLKRRRDTLTKLMDAVKGSMNFEKGTLEEIVKMRSSNIDGASMSEKAKISNDLSRISKGINVTLENYPNLKSTDAVVEFQKSTADIEDNIAASRRIYNQNVSAFNQNIKTWPAIVVAQASKQYIMPFFEATTEDREDVKVNF
jgi:LemA protein